MEAAIEDTGQRQVNSESSKRCRQLNNIDSGIPELRSAFASHEFDNEIEYRTDKEILSTFSSSHSRQTTFRPSSMVTLAPCIIAYRLK